MPRRKRGGNRLVTAPMKRILKATKAVSRTLKFLQPKGSIIHNIGEAISQRGYGLVGRVRLN